MSPVSEKQMTKERLRELALSVGLELDEDRLDLLLPQVARLLAGTQKLDEMTLGETEPATFFALKEGHPHDAV